MTARKPGPHATTGLDPGKFVFGLKLFFVQFSSKVSKYIFYFFLLPCSGSRLDEFGSG
jgi:hypothetical protein